MSNEQALQPTEAAPKRRVSTPGAALQPADAAPVAESTAGLPNAIDIDARKITGPVMTRQGWVVPDEAYLAKQRKIAELQRELGS